MKISPKKFYDKLCTTGRKMSDRMGIGMSKTAAKKRGKGKVADKKM